MTVKQLTFEDNPINAIQSIHFDAVQHRVVWQLLSAKGAGPRSTHAGGDSRFLICSRALGAKVSQALMAHSVAARKGNHRLIGKICLPRLHADWAVVFAVSYLTAYIASVQKPR